MKNRCPPTRSAAPRRERKIRRNTRNSSGDANQFAVSIARAVSTMTSISAKLLFGAQRHAAKRLGEFGIVTVKRAHAEKEKREDISQEIL